MKTSLAPAVAPRHDHGTWALTRGALAGDKWFAAGWLTALSAAVYASAQMTPWLYPTVEQRVTAAEAINGSAGIVALYGPIVDPHSLGELAMTKMTVLYSVLVVIMCIIAVRRRARASGESPGPRDLPVATSEAAVLAGLAGTVVAAASILAGLPVVGSVAFGATWAGLGLVATGVTAVSCQLSSSPRLSGAIAAGVFALLFALRAVGDTLPAAGLSWLSPFGWATRVQAWSSSPHWWILALYGVASVGLVGLARYLNDRPDRPDRAGEGRSRAAKRMSTHRRRGPLAWSMHRNWLSLAVWTVTIAGMAAYFGAISPDFDALLGSPNARDMIERLGGSGPLRDVLIAAEFSIAAVIVTAFGISAVVRAADDELAGTHTAAGASVERRLFGYTMAIALSGTTWLLFVTGAMFTVGGLADGGAATSAHVAAALNHAPAVWTIVGMAAVAWTLRPAWAKAGWVLLVVFTAIGPFGRLVGLPHWLVDFSPFARISLMPVEAFDAASTVALTAGAAVLLAIAFFNHLRQHVE